jgi:hypothetical protein
LKPDVAITVGGFAGSDAQRRSATKSAKGSDAGSDAQRRAATLKSRSAKKPASVSEPIATLYRCVCGYTDENRYKYSGHTRTCDKFKADKAAKQAIPVDFSSTPANAERGER